MDSVFVDLPFARSFRFQEALGVAFTRRSDQKPDHAVLVLGGREAGVLSRPEELF